MYAPSSDGNAPARYVAIVRALVASWSAEIAELGPVTRTVQVDGARVRRAPAFGDNVVATYARGKTVAGLLVEGRGLPWLAPVAAARRGLLHAHGGAGVRRRRDWTSPPLYVAMLAAQRRTIAALCGRLDLVQRDAEIALAALTEAEGRIADLEARVFVAAEIRSIANHMGRKPAIDQTTGAAL